VADVYVRRPDDDFTRIGPTVNPASLPPEPPGSSYDGPSVLPSGASADLSHYLFKLNPRDGYPGDESTSTSSLYEHVGTGNSRPLLVGVDNTGHQISQGSTCASGISTDGRVVFFDPGCDGGRAQVWARVNSVTTIEASASECTRNSGDPGGVCNASAPANFMGAANDGSRVFFTTSQQLVDGDTNTTDDLYECDIPPGTPAPVGAVNPCENLREVSSASSGAVVEGVPAISDDGSRAYFVAQGVLATNNGANDMAAVAGDHNLYLWQSDAAHPAGRITYVAKFDSNDAIGVQISADGRYLVLSTTTALVNSGPGADTDIAADVYRYDAKTGAMVRLSTATSGQGGNEPGLDATTYVAPASPARSRTVMSSDGGTVVFLSAEALSPVDVNGGVDVYEWHEGRVSLISSGRPSQPSPLLPFAWISASGTDIFFTTTEQLTGTDGDTSPDIYDARVGGGFDFTAAPVCLGQECQGTPTPEPDLPAARSDAPTEQGDVVRVVTVFSLGAVSATQRVRLAATGRVTLTVTANIPGVVSATATATIAGRSLRVGSVRRTMARAGTTRLVLALSKKARQRLKSVGRLSVKVAVGHSKVSATRSTTLKLTRPKSKAEGRS
jgi:hypothetical protein